MAILSPAELLDWLGQFQFLSPTQVDELRPTLASHPDTMSLAKELIRRDWLTPFQVNQIMTDKPEQLVVGDFRLRERIGEGAMGQVFKAAMVPSGRVVAIKMLMKELIKSAKAMERFRREAETASHLDHPNIAHVRDAGDIDGRPYMTMEFIDGTDLSKRVKRDGPLPVHEAVEYARQAALGLQHAFERGVVHRDIKPANLMVTTIRYNDQTMPIVKVLDFGLARFETEEDEGDRLTQLGRMLGTIDYVAPEQATDARNADVRADLYSLGCTLYYLLTGKPPFDGKDPVEKLGPRVTGDPPWVRTQCPQAPPGLEEVLRKLMARRPEDRYQTPMEAAAALEPYTAPSPPTPLPEDESKGPPIAIAMPVTGPTGPVAMAMPVTDGVPMATPVLATPVAAAPSSPNDGAFLAMSATGRDMSARSSAASVPRGTKPFPIKYAAIGGGVLLLVSAVCVGICLLASMFKEPAAKGTIRITNAWVQAPKPGEVKPGKVTFVNMEMERAGFKGRVKITLENLPSGVTGEVKVIEETVTKTWVRLTVPYDIKPSTTSFRIHAESEADTRVCTDYPLTLIILDNSDGKKK